MLNINEGDSAWNGRTIQNRCHCEQQNRVVRKNEQRSTRALFEETANCRSPISLTCLPKSHVGYPPFSCQANLTRLEEKEGKVIVFGRNDSVECSLGECIHGYLGDFPALEEILALFEEDRTKLDSLITCCDIQCTRRGVGLVLAACLIPRELFTSLYF